ncbi:MAG: serine/threonine-protein kinase [Rivularia sp. (in: cyanobacteria)]
MICCLNPTCDNPPCAEDTILCPNCQIPLVILRNRYQPIQSLGGGGFGKTYIAEDIDKLNEYCVIKQFAPQVQGTAGFEGAKKLFELEARRLQQLGENPQIPRLLAYFEENSRLYLLQQFIDGQNLLQELEQQGIFEEPKTLQLLFDVLEILQVVHQQKVIHRDIKPENIIRRSIDYKLVLIDFGASKQWSETIMSAQGTMIGSFGYVPIEQIQYGKAYPSSDLYSLGATCFHLLSGIRPWELWYKQGYSWVNNWRSHLPQPVSQELAEILDGLLQEDYGKRYQSVEEVLEDLNSSSLASEVSEQNPIKFQAAFSPSKVPETIIKPSKVPQRISQILFSFLSTRTIKFKELSLVIGGVLLASLGGYGMQNVILRSQQLEENLEENIDYQKLALVKTLEGGKGKNCYVYSVAISPDGKTLVNSSNDKTLKFWDFKTKEPLKVIPETNIIRSLAISPNGQIIVSGSEDGVIRIWNLKTKELKKTLKAHTKTIRSITISPDGKTLISGSSDNTIKIWNIETGDLKEQLTKHKKAVYSMVLASDGKTLISGSGDKTIKIWNLETGELKQEFNNPQSEILSLALTPDGKTLISGSADGSIQIWNIQTGEQENLFPKVNKWIGSLIVTEDGKSLISGSADGSIQIWNLETRELIKKLSQHKYAIYSLSISPDGKSLISGSADCKINIWQR